LAEGEVGGVASLQALDDDRTFYHEHRVPRNSTQSRIACSGRLLLGYFKVLSKGTEGGSKVVSFDPS